MRQGRDGSRLTRMVTSDQVPAKLTAEFRAGSWGSVAN